MLLLKTCDDPLFPSIMAEGSGSVSLAEVETAFKKFAMHGDTKATGKDMTGKNFAKLCKDCRVIDGKSVTGTDVDIVFSKVKYASAAIKILKCYMLAMLIKRIIQECFVLRFVPCCKI